MTTELATDAIRRFRDLRLADIPFADGKGANLGELTSSGAPVPGGFVIGAPAYNAFCEHSGLRQQLTAALNDLHEEDTSALEAAAARAREELDASPIPDWLEQAIRAAYDELAAGDPQMPVAVRSSATAEDTEAASFAGMNGSRRVQTPRGCHRTSDSRH